MQILRTSQELNFKKGFKKMNKEATLDKLKAVKCRSAWSKGVKEYAYLLLDNIFSYSDCKSITDFKSLHEELLDGKKNWHQFSWGGYALIYDEGIAKTLCSPSELKKCKNGILRPNKKEQWLDVQAQALFQAEKLIKDCVEF